MKDEMLNNFLERKSQLALYYGDCFDLIKHIPDESIDLTLTSPPYCMGKVYEKNVIRTENFIENHIRLLPEIVRITKPGGSICWQVGYHVQDGAITPLDYLVHNVLKDYKSSIYLRNRIIWTYGHGLHCEQRFSGRHEVVLWYTKGKDFRFNLDAVRVPQKYPGKRHYKGDKKGEFSGNPLGKNPSDVWEIPNVKANHVEKTEHPCQFPVALAQRLIRSLTPKNGVVFDPFLGVGSSAVASVLDGRCFIGSEIDQKYFGIAYKRCMEVLRGNGKYRQDKPILVPDQNTSVARKPTNFK